MNTLRDNLRIKIKEAELTQEQLAELAGVSQNAISLLVSGKSKRSNNINKIAKVLNTTADWLMYGTGEEYILNMVPILDYIQAGQWTEISHSYQTDKWQQTTAKITPTTFALKVRGDSMTNPIGSPSIPEGSIIIVNPQERAENGSIVVAMLANDNQATVKKLVFDLNKRYLRPLNPSYNTLEIDDSCQIIGVVKQIVFDL